MMTGKDLATEIAWLSDGDLDELADALTSSHPTVATRLEKRLAVWRERVTPKPAPAPAPARKQSITGINIVSGWFR